MKRSKIRTNFRIGAWVLIYGETEENRYLHPQFGSALNPA